MGTFPVLTPENPDEAAQAAFEANIALERQRRRLPSQPRVQLPPETADIPRGGFLRRDIPVGSSDLLSGRTLGERIIVHGTVLDETGAPFPNILIETWQVNAAGRYADKMDNTRDVPLDEHFQGGACMLTDALGQWRLTTIKPPPYPGGGQDWRRGHIHFSLTGPQLRSRLITQMYFEGDPVHIDDRVSSAIADQERQKLMAQYDRAETAKSAIVTYQWNIVLRGTAQSRFGETA